ncbi:MAG: M23 family metallopeptidase, partial [Candidatus Binatia bacterium]
AGQLARCAVPSSWVVMRRPVERLLGEQFERDGSRALLTIAPLFFLAVFSLLVRNADSSSAFRLDQSWVLDRLKREVLREEELARAPEVVIEDAGIAPKIELLPAEIREVREVVRRGDTFGGILKRLGIDSGEVTRWSAAAREYASLADLKPGNNFTFLLPSGTSRLAGLQYELDIDSALVMREVGDEVSAAVERLPSTVDVLAVAAEIQTTLYGAAVDAGVPDEIVSQVVDVFGWEVDFDSELRAGDTFRIAYEEQRGPSGKRIGGRLLAAEITSGARTWQAFRFQSADDGGKYYTADGRPYGRAFLRYPVEFSRITSQFSKSRFHPILRVRRPHYGVDFAAASGTPVRSIGAGRVVSAGWNGGHGRFVKVRHGDGVESSYSHLRSIGRGIRRGVRIELGDVVGTVGATGLATGPHLHFAMWKNGAYVDPNSVKLPVAPVIKRRHREAFEDARSMLLTQLAEAKIQSKPIVTVLATSPSNGG